MFEIQYIEKPLNVLNVSMFLNISQYFQSFIISFDIFFFWKKNFKF